MAFRFPHRNAGPRDNFDNLCEWHAQRHAAPGLGEQLRSILSTLSELATFLWKEKMWWMVPMILIMLIFVAVIVLGNSSSLGPFIYTLF